MASQSRLAGRRMAGAFVVAGILAWMLSFGAPELHAQTSNPTLSANPAAAQFSYTLGGTVPKEQKITIKQSAGAALTFTVAVSSGAGWLIVTPSTGKTGTAISLYVNPSSLLAGDYVATLTIDAVGSSGPIAVPVTFKIRNPPPTMSVAPNAATFTWKTDTATPAAQALTVSTDGEPVTLQVVASGGTWLSVDKATGIAVAGSPFTFSAVVTPQGLNPGSYTGKISVSSTNAANKKVEIAATLTVSPGTAVISTLWPNAAPIGSNDTTITLRGQHLFKDVSVVKAGATSLTASWISTDAMLAVVPKTLLATQGAIAITVANPNQPASNTVNFTVTPPGPQIQAVVNAASFSASQSGGNTVVAPGELIAIFGSGMGPSVLTQAAPVCNPAPCAYPTTLGTPATLVEFELTATVWTPAPLIFVSANQINAMVPFAATAGGPVNLRVTYNALASTAVVLSVETAEPGLFTSDSTGRGQGAILNFNATAGTYTLNSGNNPALKGSTVVLYLTGGGALNPAPATEGVVIGTGTPPVLANAPSVTIGGDGATVTYAGAAPGSISGLAQLNITVPTTVKAAKDLPLVVTIAGRPSPATATISVK